MTPISELVFSGTFRFLKDIPGQKFPTAALAAGFLRGLQEQTDLRLRIGARARRTALEYSRDRNAAAVWELLQRTLAKEIAVAP